MADDLGTLRGRIVLDVSNALNGYRQVRQQHQQIIFSARQMGDALTQSGRSMVRGGTAIIGVFAKAVTSAAEFERRMDFIGAVTNATAGEMKLLSAATLEMASNSIYSANEVADGFVELGKAGIGTKQILAGVGQAMINLGAAADIPLIESGQILTVIMAQFGIAASHASDIADRLAGSANAAIIDVSDLGVSFKYVGGVAEALGLKFDDVTTALTILGKAGIKGSTAGTSLRQMIVSLGGSTKPAIAALTEIGIITKKGTNLFYDQAGALKPLSSIYQILQDHLQGYTQKQKLAFLRTIFNNRALAAAAILTKNGAKGFADMNKEISKTSAADVAAKRLDNLSGDIKKLKTNIDVFLIKSGTPFQNFMRGIVQDLTGLVKAFGNLPPGVQTATLSFIAIVGALLIFVGTVNIILGSIFRFVDIMFRLAGAGEAFGAVFKVVGRVMLFLLNPVKLLIRLIGSLLIAIGPIGWIVLAIIALGAAFIYAYKHSATFRAIVQKIGAALKQAGEAILQFLQPVIQGFKQLVAAAAQTFGKVIAEFNRLKGLSFGQLVLAIIKDFGKLQLFIFQVWAKINLFIIKMAAKIVLTVVKFLLGLAPAALSALGAFLVNVLQFFALLPARILVFMVKFQLAVINAFLGLAAKILPALGFLIGFIIGFFIRLNILAIQYGLKFIQAVANWFVSLPGRIAGGLAALYGVIVSGIGRALSFAASAGPRIAAGILSGLASLPGKVGSILSKIPGAIVKLVSTGATAARRVSFAIKDGINFWLSKIPGLVSGALGKAIAAFKGVVSKAFSAAKSFAKGLWDGFKAGLGINSPSLIEKQMYQITAVTMEEAKKLNSHVKGIQGLSKSLASSKFGTGFDLRQYADLATAQKAAALRQSQIAAQLGVGQSAVSLAVSNNQADAKRGIIPMGGKIAFDDKTGKVMFQGWAQEVYEGQAEFEESIRGLGGGS